MAKNNEALKKHHFWILLGVIPLLVMIAVVTVSSSVGGAIDDRVKLYTDSQKSIASKTNPKSNKLIEAVAEQSKKVSDRKGDLWDSNWERQKDLFVWPTANSTKLKEIADKKHRFGDPIVNDKDQFEEFKKPEVYLAEFSNKQGTGMADSVAPTQFLNGWQSQIRHVVAKGWGLRTLTSDQVWLLLEDIWVQRSMLQAVRSVNSQMAAFDRVEFKDTKTGATIDDPLRRKFRSRIWDVELQVVREDNKQVLKGRLANHTDRLQLMGLNNTMTLRVWFEKPEDAKGNLRKDVRSWDFKIGGEFLAGAGALKPDGKTPADVLDIVPTADHIIPATMPIVEIARVEQVFDTRTVPIRRIEAMALGYLDSRYAAVPLSPPKFIKMDEMAADPGTGGSGQGMAPPGALGQGSSGGRPSLGGADTGGMGGMGGTGASNRFSGGGTIETAVNANKKRYVAVTPAVRRMPVAMSVVVDQSYMQDVELAFANSPLRFQITQVTWARFRKPLSGLGNDGTGGAGDMPGGGLVYRPPTGGGAGVQFGTGGSLGGPPKRPGRGTPGAGLPGAGLSGPGGPGSSGASLPGPMGDGTGGGFDPTNPYGGSGGLTVSESQLTSGLIELTIYGIVSLYEKQPAPGEAPVEPTTTPKDGGAKKDPTDTKDPGTDKKDPMETPKEKDPKDMGMGKKDPMETPKEKDPKTKEPMPGETKPPKGRRRPLARR